MAELTPDQIWWTASEIAEQRLPDMPTTQQSIDRLAKRNNWRGQAGLARRRQGRGGGWEYHWHLFPSTAQRALLATATMPEPSAPSVSEGAEVMERDVAWQWFETLPDKVKQQAKERLQTLMMVDGLVRAGMGRDLAVHDVARVRGVSHRTIWNWLSMVECVRRDDRLPYLAPRNRLVPRKGPRAECSEDFMGVLKADYLRPERPSFSACYRRACRIAKEQGWAVLADRTARRRLYDEVPELTRVLSRKGVDALKAMYPAQTRDRSALHAMEAVNADYHRFDVFVRWPDGEIVRPQMCAFQDIYSGRLLSWRVDKTPNKVGVSLALGDMIERFGIPDHVLLDNGREFANKFLTGQVPTRFRFKVKEDDIPGILKVLGCQVHWATPYSGQSKPIERAFRDLCDDVAKDPRFAGAYTGNRPDAKPENYGSTAIPLERFLDVLAEGIEEHNAREGRRGQTAQGRSLLETFDASYAEAPIRMATEEQRRLWLMGAEGLKADARSGLLRFEGNEYWSAWMHGIAGQKVVARFDPADYRAGLHVYALDGAYLGHAECKLAAGFFDLEEARNHAAARRKWVKAEKAAAEAHRKLKVAEIGDYLDAGKAGKPAPAPAAKVVRPAIFDQAPKPKPAKKIDPDFAAARAALVANFSEAKATRPQKSENAQARERYRSAKELEARIAAGEAVTRDQERWLEGYRTMPEYKAHKALEEGGKEGSIG